MTHPSLLMTLNKVGKYACTMKNVSRKNLAKKHNIPDTGK